MGVGEDNPPPFPFPYAHLDTVLADTGILSVIACFLGLTNNNDMEYNSGVRNDDEPTRFM